MDKSNKGLGFDLEDGVTTEAGRKTSGKKRAF